jgi:predicted amidohydrolase
MTRLRAGLVQLRTPADPAAALAQAAPLVRQAAAGGAQLIMTPEATNVLQRDREKLMQVVRPLEEDVCVQGLLKLARELKVWLLIGSALVKRPDGQLANRAVLADDRGQVITTYDKIHMFDVDLPTGERHRESALYTPGEQASVAQTPWGKLGFTICYDVRFPYLHRALAKAGAEMIVVPAAFTRPTGEAHWEVLLRARAIETGSYVLAPAQGGTHEDGRATWGHSTVIDPWGRVVGKLDHEEPGVLIADLDLDEVAKARAAIPALVNERAFAGP